MYRINNKEGAVREIQKYLHFVSDRVDNSVPRVSIDGVYGKETEAAVKSFQTSKGLVSSGIVDYETFTELYESYKLYEFLKETEEFYIDEALFPFKYGDFGNEILFLNLLLNELSMIFDDIYKAPAKPYFTRETERAVRDIRKVFLMEDSPYIDLFLYDRMRYELYIRGNKY